MRRTVAHCFVAYLLTASVGNSASPQDQVAQEVRIEIQGQPEDIPYGYEVRMIDLENHMNGGRNYEQSGSVFTLRNIPFGDYQLQVSNPNGQVVRQEIVNISRVVTVFHVNLMPQQRTRPAAGRVSVRELQNPPSRKALKAFERARKQSELKQPAKAIEELQTAVRISPDFAEAYTNLAANYDRLGQYEQALASANRAMEIGEPDVMNLCNRAIAEWGLQRYEDAMRSAERALELDGNAATAHFVLGSLQARNPKTRREGIRHLERAAEANPAAARNLEWARAALEEQ